MASLSSFLKNPFDILISKARSVMNEVLRDHMSRLMKDITDREIKRFYERISDTAFAYQDRYTALDRSIQDQKAATQRVSDKLDDLSQRINLWDMKIQILMNSKSADYTSLMAYGKAPFKTGSHIEREMALKSLVDGLNRVPELFDLKIEIETFYTDLQDLKEEQKQKVLACRQVSSEIDIIRKQAATYLFANLVDLVSKYINESERVMQYFNSTLLTPRKPRKSKSADIDITEIPDEEKTSENQLIDSENPVG
jgi:hypothetical protein